MTGRARAMLRRKVARAAHGTRSTTGINAARDV